MAHVGYGYGQGLAGGDVWWFPRKGGKLVSVTPHGSPTVITPPVDPDTPDTPPVNITGGGLPPIADAQVYAYDYRNWNKANWGAYNILGAGPSAIGGEKRTYIKFDVSRLNIPAGKRVKLRLFHYHSAGDSNYPLGIFRVTSPWKEGRGTYHSGTTEAPAGPGEISWVQQPATSPNVEAQFSPGSKANKYVKVDITNLVKSWQSGQANNGLMIAGLQPTRGTSVYGFYSREHADAAKRPALVIDSPSGSDAPPPPPPAAEALQVRADHKQVQKGDTFYLPIWLDFPQTFSRARDGRINAANLNVEISYDPNVLKAGPKIMPGNVLGGALFQSNPGQPGVIKLGFATQKGIQNSGTLAQLSFQAIGQPGQRSPITVRITTANDDQGRTPPTKAVHGYVEIVKEGVTGDINGNGAVDAGDALAALKMSVGLTPQNMILNVDKKDEVTSNDARLLLQMAVQGGTITTPPPRVHTPPPRQPAVDTPAVTTAHTADARRAYQGYIAAYNKMTSLMAKGQADSPAGKSAYAAYQKAKDKYEAAIKTQSPVSGVE